MHISLLFSRSSVCSINCWSLQERKILRFKRGFWAIRRFSSGTSLWSRNHGNLDVGCATEDPGKVVNSAKTCKTADYLKMKTINVSVNTAIRNVILFSLYYQICPGLNAYEIQIPYDKHHKVSSLVKRSPKHTQFSQIWSSMNISNNPAKYELLIKRYLRSILEIIVYHLPTGYRFHLFSCLNSKATSTGTYTVDWSTSHVVFLFVCLFVFFFVCFVS